MARLLRSGLKEQSLSLSRGRAGLIMVGYDVTDVDRLVSNLSILPLDDLVLTFQLILCRLPTLQVSKKLPLKLKQSQNAKGIN